MLDIFFYFSSTNFDKDRFQRIFEIVSFRWPDSKIYFFTDAERCAAFESTYGAKPEVLDDSHIPMDFWERNNNIKIAIILRDIFDNNPKLTWDAPGWVTFYRDYLDGYGGLRIVGGKSNEIDYPQINTQIFSRLSHNLQGEQYYFPYGYHINRNNFGDTNELGFRIKGDYKILTDRDKNHKLITIFGGSGSWDIFANHKETFAKKLENKLNKHYSGRYTFSVLNFSMLGNVVINEMINYLLYGYELSPDIVIAHDGFNDFIFSQSTDSYLLERYKITYNKLLEKWADVAHSELNMNIYKNSASSVVLTYYERKKEFETLVSATKSIFISGLQPNVYQKKAVSKKEQEYMSRFDYELFKNAQKNINFLYDVYKKLVNDRGGCRYQLFFDDIFANFDDHYTLFGDFMHQLPAGNEIISDAYMNLIIGILDEK